MCFGLLFVFLSCMSIHTRYWRDWSSDVFSSDLDGIIRFQAQQAHALRGAAGFANFVRVHADDFSVMGDDHDVGLFRSEERRVGKECSTGWAANHYNS